MSATEYEMVRGERCRLSLLRMLADLRDFEVATGRYTNPDWPTHVPLFSATTEAERGYPDDLCLLAAKEATAMGHIDGKMCRVLPGFSDFFMRITDEGYAYIRAHDIVGELEQEPRPEPPK